jgi:hypothetical protein
MSQHVGLLWKALIASYLWEDVGGNRGRNGWGKVQGSERIVEDGVTHLSLQQSSPRHRWEVLHASLSTYVTPTMQLADSWKLWRSRRKGLGETITEPGEWGGTPLKSGSHSWRWRGSGAGLMRGFFTKTLGVACPRGLLSCTQFK